jgi:hypothetical protein
MLQVRFAEVNRNAFLQAGLNLFAAHEDFAARSTTQQFAGPNFDSEKPDLLQFTTTSTFSSFIAAPASAAS